MIDSAVLHKLLATSAITTLVSTRIYPDVLPQPAPTFPAISVSLTSDIPSIYVSKGNEARVTVSCWSNPPVSNGLRSPAEVQTVAAAVKAVMHKPLFNNSPERWTITGTSTSYDIITRRVTDGTRIIENPNGWYHIPVDVLMSYREV